MAMGYTLPRVLASDPYGPNPLVEDLRTRSQEFYDQAKARQAPPTLFASGGDLPPFTASGVDPALLRQLPYQWRHFAAAEPEAGKVLALLEEAGGDRERSGQAGGIPSQGLDDYRQRMENWTRGMTWPDVDIEDAGYPDGWLTPGQRKHLDNRGSDRPARGASLGHL